MDTTIGAQGRTAAARSRQSSARAAGSDDEETTSTYSSFTVDLEHYSKSEEKGSASPPSTQRRYWTKWLCAYWVSLLCTISSLAGSL